MPLPGPIFIHAEPCERYPENAGYPEPLRDFSSVITSFGDNQQILTQTHVDHGDHPVIVQQLLADTATRYLHVRDKNAGCFTFRISRVGE